MTITPKQVDELKAAATPGPYLCGATRCPDQDTALALSEENILKTTKCGTHFFEVYIEDGRRIAMVGHGFNGLENSVFIAAVHDMADLIAKQAAEIERLKAELTETQHALQGASAVIQKAVDAAQQLAPFVLAHSKWNVEK